MSATFKLSKKKVSQDQLRKLLINHKDKLNDGAKRIESPLAKYNDGGQLTCVLCNSVVRSDNVWQVHLNSKQHKLCVEQAKLLKAKTQNFTAVPKVPPVNVFKRPGSPVSVHNNKKIKSILKNSTSAAVSSSVPSDFFDVGSFKDPSAASASTSLADAVISQQELEKINIVESSGESTLTVQEPDDVLPEGFFDDPIMDAKARNIQYKDPIEEEWEKFQKEMKEETNVSAAIIAGEQEEATAERQIDEIDEQLRNWSRVLDLERKKEEAAKLKALESTAAMECEDNSSDDGEDIDEFLDWRAKKF